MRIPTVLSGRHPLEELIGVAALRALVDELGGQYLTPRTEADDMLIYRDRKAADMFATGATATQVAVMCGVTPRRAGQIRQALTASGLIDYARQNFYDVELEAEGESPAAFGK